MPAHRRPRQPRRIPLLGARRAAPSDNLPAVRPGRLPATPDGARFTMIALWNITTGPHGWPVNYFGYHPWHQLVEARDPAEPGQRMLFGINAPDHLTAAIHARAIGRSLTTDVSGRYWPTTARRLFNGDVIGLTDQHNNPAHTRFFALAPHQRDVFGEADPDAMFTEIPSIARPLQVTQLPAIAA